MTSPASSKSIVYMLNVSFICFSIFLQSKLDFQYSTNGSIAAVGIPYSHSSPAGCVISGMIRAVFTRSVTQLRKSDDTSSLYGFGDDIWLEAKSQNAYNDTWPFICRTFDRMYECIRIRCSAVLTVRILSNTGPDQSAWYLLGFLQPHNERRPCYGLIHSRVLQ